jgi:hypothetical protein
VRSSSRLGLQRGEHPTDGPNLDVPVAEVTRSTVTGRHEGEVLVRQSHSGESDLDPEGDREGYPPLDWDCLPEFVAAFICW